MNKNHLLVLSVSVLSISALWLVSTASFWRADSTSSSLIEGSAEKGSAKTVFPTLQEVLPETEIQAAVLSPDEVWISEGVKQQMEDIAGAYAENIRYPVYSKPLSDSDWNLLNPRAFVPKSVPLDTHQGLSAEIVLEHYIVSQSEDLDVSVSIKGQGIDRYGDQLGASSVSLYILNDKQRLFLTNLNFSGSDRSVSTYTSRVAASKLSGLDSGERQLLADIQFDDGERAAVTAVIKLTPNDATLNALGSPYIEGADLLIPAHFKVNVPGYYRIQANLFDESGQVPISHLNASFLLSKHETSGLLKVHASTLRNKGLAGPYLLTDFNITRGPASPGDKTGYGSASEVSYLIPGFDLNSYSHEAYEDPKNRQRLEFLQKMAGIE